MCRLQGSPEYRAWAARKRRSHRAGVMCSFLAVVFLLGGIFLGVQQMPVHLALPAAPTTVGPELHMPLAAAALEAGLRDSHLALEDLRAALTSTQLELDAALAELGKAKQVSQGLQDRAAASQARAEDLRRDLEAAQAAAQRARHAHSMDAQAREDGLRRQLECMREQLLAAAAREATAGQHPGLPAGGVAMVTLALATAFWLGFRHAAARAARAHRGEVMALHRQVETQEVGALCS